MSEQAIPATVAGVIEADLLVRDDELMRRFRAGVHRALVTQIASGQPVYSGGAGAQAGRLFVHLPDGRTCEYRVREDGTHEIVRDRAS